MMDMDPGRSAASDRDPKSAHMWCRLLGGLDHFPADLAALRALDPVLPELPAYAAWTRRRHERQVAAAARRGVHQHLDLGCGTPQKRGHNTHETAGGSALTVYVDNCRSAVTYSRGHMQRAGVQVVRADVRVPGLLCHPDVAAHLDLTVPLAVYVTSVLEYLDDQGAGRLLGDLVTGLPPGSTIYVTTMIAPDLKRARTVNSALRTVVPRTGWRLRTPATLHSVIPAPLLPWVRTREPIPSTGVHAAVAAYTVPAADPR